MQSFFNSISAVLVVLLMMLTGYFMGSRGWLNASHKPLLVKLIINIGMPCMCINNIQQNLNIDMLRDSWWMLLIPLAAVFFTMIAAFFAARLLRLEHGKVGVFMVMAGLSNCVFVGYPMCIELFGDESITYVMMFFLVNTALFQSLGVALLQYSGRPEGAALSLSGLKTVLKNPPFLSVVAGVLMLLLNIRLPSVLMSFTKYMGGIVSPLGLIYSGFVLYEIGLKNAKFERGIPTMLLLRFALCPLVCVLLALALNLPKLACSVFAVESAMPTMTQSVVLSASLGADEQFAAKGAVLSLLGCFVVIPVLMLIIA